MVDYERERLEDRITGMSPEEQAVAVTLIDTDLLWDELRKREIEEREFQKAMTKIVRDKMG